MCIAQVLLVSSKLSNLDGSLILKDMVGGFKLTVATEFTVIAAISTFSLLLTLLLSCLADSVEDVIQNTIKI
jgi:hypothetical protein